jgi:hypothetical protein
MSRSAPRAHAPRDRFTCAARDPTNLINQIDSNPLIISITTAVRHVHPRRSRHRPGATWSRHLAAIKSSGSHVNHALVRFTIDARHTPDVRPGVCENLGSFLKGYRNRSLRLPRTTPCFSSENLRLSISSLIKVNINPVGTCRSKYIASSYATRSDRFGMETRSRYPLRGYK